MRHSLPHWEFRQAGTREWLPAQVPGCVHTDLLRNRKIPDPFYGANEQPLQWIEEADWEYRCLFSSSQINAGKLALVAEGLDTVAAVYLNGHLLGRTENMFLRHSWPVDKYLKEDANELRICFESPMKYIRRVRQAHRPFDHQDWVGGCTRIRKQQSSFGWDWGPRLATSGIWKEIYLESEEDRQIGDFRIIQHLSGRKARLHVRFANPIAEEVQTTLSLRGNVVAESTGDNPLTISEAELWWPNGHGDHPLYDLEISLSKSGRKIAQAKKRIGLRSIQLRQESDKTGRSFEFVVNGRRIFAKGANWIPAHAFVAGMTRAHYEPLLRSAVDANMNMLRVWGGGIYEHDSFYDLCDEAGLLVWQDFMFACSLYPGDTRFLNSVREEATQQVRRLRHHACLALWCGNNEIEILPQNLSLMKSRPRYRRAYDAVFKRILPSVVRIENPETAYHRSSPLGSQTDGVPPTSAKQWGDAHNWDVFHSKNPLNTYERSNHRFVSEFGMQALVTPEVAQTFCDERDFNIASPAMENHQKHPAGNNVILEYVLRRYRFPGDYASLAYLSQLNQAEAMRVAIEHFRRCAPHTMGALYWQFNDCWPAASWSGLEFGGRWRALQYELRRLFAPVVLCPQLPCDVVHGQGNLAKWKTGEVFLWMACDDPKGTKGRLEWSVVEWNGQVKRSGVRQVKLGSLESRCIERLDFRALFKSQLSSTDVYFRCRFTPAKGSPIETIRFFLPPRYLDLPRCRPTWQVKKISAHSARLLVKSSHFLHAVCIDGFPELDRLSDNFFDLECGETKEIDLSFRVPISQAALGKRLCLRSLADSYGATGTMLQ